MSIIRSIIVAAAFGAPLGAQLGAQSASRQAPPLHVDPGVTECSIRFASTLTQHNFRRFVREFGSVSAFKQGGSPSGLEAGKVTLGVDMISFPLEDTSDAWNDTFVHPNDHHPLGSRQGFPQLNVRAGLTDDLDVGGYYSRNPKANYGWAGIDAKYRVLNERDDNTTSIALRGAYTKTLYVSDMDMHAATADISVSRRMGWVRPYAGVGADGVYARATSSAVTLHNESVIAPHAFAGVNATLLRRINLGAEFTLGALPSAQVQLAAVLF